MTTQRYVLTDVASNLYLEDFAVSSKDEPRLGVRKSRLRGGLSDGVDVVVLDNGRWSVSVLPTRGMGIWQANCNGFPLRWGSPAQLPVNPAFVDQTADGGIGWLKGFNELLCRCGLEANGPPGVDPLTGRPITLHGKIANLPAHHVEVELSNPAHSSGEPRSISVTGVVDEAMLFGTHLRLTSTVRLEAHSNRLTIRDEVRNMKGTSAELQLLYHTNVGRPLIGGGAKLHAPIREAAPRDAVAAAGMATFDHFEEPQAVYPEQVFFFDLAADETGNTLVLIETADGERGLTVEFNKSQLPWFILWKNHIPEADGYVVGLEPSLNFPHFKAFEREQGRVRKLAPQETWSAEWHLAMHTGTAALDAVKTRIRTLQGPNPPIVHRTPKPGWSPT